ELEVKQVRHEDALVALEGHFAAAQEREEVVPARRRRITPESLPALGARPDGEAPGAHGERAALDPLDAACCYGDEILRIAHLHHEGLVHVPTPAHDRRVVIHELWQAFDHGRGRAVYSSTASRATGRARIATNRDLSSAGCVRLSPHPSALTPRALLRMSSSGLR